MKLFYRQLSVIAFLVLCFVGACLSSDSVKFDLTAEMVETAWANEVSQGFSNVNVLLKDEYKKHLLELTENIIGKSLRITIVGIESEILIESDSPHLIAFAAFVEK